MSQNKRFRQSRDGYAFDENENFWRISKDNTINFSQPILNINKKVKKLSTIVILTWDKGLSIWN